MFAWVNCPETLLYSANGFTKFTIIVGCYTISTVKSGNFYNGMWLCLLIWYLNYERVDLYIEEL